MPQRFDFVPFAVAQRTPEGFVMDSPIVGRTGIQIYRNADGSERREYRPPDEVFKADALASMRGKPITVDHPSGGVDKDNAAFLTVGAILSDGKKDGVNVRADIVIHAPDKMGERRELSLGYAVDLEMSPGVSPEGERYDAIQRNISINHCAVVAKGRAGVARLNLDGDEEVTIHQPEQTKMPKLKLDTGIEYEVPAEVAAAHTSLTAKADTLAQTVTTLTAKVDTVTAERDGLKAKIDAQPAAIKAAEDAAREQGRKDAAARADLETVAAAYKVDHKGKTDKEVRMAVIMAANPKFDAKDKSDAYIDAVFDMAKESKADAVMALQRQTVNGNGNGGATGGNGGGNTGKTDGDDLSYEAAQRKHMDELGTFKLPGASA
jgi:hypothetical protein